MFTIRTGLLLAAIMVTACGPGSGTYCQTGAKYGTQCFAEPDVRRTPGAYEAPDHTPVGEAPPTAQSASTFKWK